MHYAVSLNYGHYEIDNGLQYPFLYSKSMHFMVNLTSMSILSSTPHKTYCERLHYSQ